MLNKFTIFLMLFIVWNISILFVGTISLTYVLLGLIVSIFITVFLFKMGIINTNTEFYFLQFGFYAYIFAKVNSNIFQVFKICCQFLDSDTKFVPLFDYVFLNKDSDSESVIIANLLTILPGTLGILMKKRYLIVHSLDKEYFSLTDMYNISIEIEKIDDDSLI